MAARLGAQLGLLALALSLFAGIVVGNSPTTILSRGLLAMVMAIFLGQFVGWAADRVIRDHLQRRKMQIDQEHAAARPEEDAPADAPTPTET